MRRLNLNRLLCALAVVAATRAAAAPAEDAGGPTFDFAAISARRFPAGSGAAILPAEWKSGYCHIHNSTVPTLDPRRAEVPRAVRWETDGDELVIVKDASLREICGSDEVAAGVSGGYSHVVRLPDASGGVYRVSMFYRLRHDLGTDAWLLATPVAAKDPVAAGVSAPGDSDVRLQSYPLTENWGDFYTYERDIRVPAGCDALSLVVRIDGVGELRFRDFRVSRVSYANSVTLKAVPADYFDGTFAFPAGQCGLPVWLWRKNDASARFEPGSFTFVLTLPKGYSFVDTTMGDPEKVTRRDLPDGGAEWRIPGTSAYSGCHLAAEFRGWFPLNALVRAAPDAPRGKMRFHAECGGVRVSDVSETEVFTVPAPSAPMPKRYCNGFYVGGEYAAFRTEAGREGFAEMFTSAGANWVVQMRPDAATLAAWRRRGVRYVTPESSALASNGFRVGAAKGRPAEERYVPRPGAETDYLALATCPLAVVEESGYFREDTLPRLKAYLEGTDGFWANWEPFMFRGRGCFCAKCRAAFAAFVGVADEAMAADWPAELAFGRRWHEAGVRFRSAVHAKLVKVLDRHVRAFTGGERSLGFIPGISWTEMASSWRRTRDAEEVAAIDYAGSLKWVDPWGPYPWWDASTPYVPTGFGDLGYFLAAKDVREQVDRDYGKDAPGLMAFPHGVQLNTCLTQPESIALALDSFFFNRWESAIAYAFPKGYDARYWRAFAEATARAAKYEDVVWDGVRCDARVTLVRDAAAPYPPNARTVYARYLPEARDVPLLQHAAYAKGGRLVVAVFNFAERDAASFRLSFAAKGDMTLDGRPVPAEALRAGVPLAVPAMRCRVFEFEKPGQEQKGSAK